MLKPQQLKLIHVARRQLDLDDADYREILREKGGVGSSKDLDNRSFENVMAHFEHMGFRSALAAGNTPADRFRMRQFRGDIFASARQLHLIRDLLPKQQYSIEQVCMRLSKGRIDQPEKLTRREAFQVIEMLKATTARTARRADTAQPSVDTAQAG